MTSGLWGLMALMEQQMILVIGNQQPNRNRCIMAFFRLDCRCH
jgi:hypothetical protein